MVLLATAVLADACAAGEQTGGGGGERGTRHDWSAADWPTWSDRGADASRSDVRRDAPRDLLAGDHKLAADVKPKPDTAAPLDSAKLCPDVHEPNELCSAAASLGDVVEAAGLLTRTATLDPASDSDWYTVIGREKSHTCFPLTSQCFAFKVSVDVPAGRAFKVCLQQDGCTATQNCVNNASAPGPAQLTVQYKVSGTCGATDDTTAKILVVPADGKGGCTPYTIAYRYDSC